MFIAYGGGNITLNKDDGSFHMEGHELTALVRYAIEKNLVSVEKRCAQCDERLSESLAMLFIKTGDEPHCCKCACVKFK